MHVFTCKAIMTNEYMLLFAKQTINVYFLFTLEWSECQFLRMIVIKLSALVRSQKFTIGDTKRILIAGKMPQVKLISFF